MARNLPVAFAAILAGGVLLDAAIKDAAIGDVIKGQAQASSSGSSSGAGAGSSGDVNPFGRASRMTVGRTDQGVDVTLAPGDPIDSPFAAKVTAINPNWYSGQPQVVIGRLDQAGKLTGEFQYYAEQITPSVHVGQVLQAGQQLGTYASSGTALEAGYASNAQGQTLARATTGYVEGQATAAGHKFLSWLQSVGVGLGGGT